MYSKSVFLNTKICKKKKKADGRTGDNKSKVHAGPEKSLDLSYKILILGGGGNKIASIQSQKRAKNTVSESSYYMRLHKQ